MGLQAHCRRCSGRPEAPCRLCTPAPCEEHVLCTVPHRARLDVMPGHTQNTHLHGRIRSLGKAPHTGMHSYQAPRWLHGPSRNALKPNSKQG